MAADVLVDKTKKYFLTQVCGKIHTDISEICLCFGF